MNSLIGCGSHRGGKEIFGRALPAEVERLYVPEWTLVDPKEGRAEQLAQVVRHRFPTVRPRPLQMTAQHALAHSKDADRLVVAVDTPAGTRETLEAARRRMQCATWQEVGRGPGGTSGARIGLQGTLVPGDSDTETGALLTLRTLEGMTLEASSRVLTGPDPFTAAILRPMREAVSQQTARHIMEKDRDPWDLSGGPLSVCFGSTLYPLLPVQGIPQDKPSHRKALALEVAGTLPLKASAARGPGGRWVVVIAVIEGGAIHFIKVVSAMGKRHVAGVTIFEPPRRQPQASSSIGSAVFTD